MWYGKVSVIMFVFCFGLLFSAYFVNTTFHDPILNVEDKAAIDAIIGSFTISPSIDSALIFGDFIHTKDILVNLLQGKVFTDANNLIVANSGFGQEAVKTLMSLIFVSASAFFILYIISNRSI